MQIICFEFELSLIFDKYIWPIILANPKMYDLFVTKKPGFFERLRTGENQLSFFRLGEMESLSKEQVSDLELRSFYAGNMDVFYRLRDIDFIMQIIKANSSQGNLIKDLNDLPACKDKIMLIKNFLREEGNKNSMFMAFGHDADIMYLFGVGNAAQELANLF